MARRMSALETGRLIHNEIEKYLKMENAKDIEALREYLQELEHGPKEPGLVAAIEAIGQADRTRALIERLENERG